MVPTVHQNGLNKSKTEPRRTRKTQEQKQTQSNKKNQKAPGRTKKNPEERRRTKKNPGDEDEPGRTQKNEEETVRTRETQDEPGNPSKTIMTLYQQKQLVLSVFILARFRVSIPRLRRSNRRRIKESNGYKKGDKKGN